jgi:hypothetical protein
LHTQPTLYVHCTPSSVGIHSVLWVSPLPIRLKSRVDYYCIISTYLAIVWYLFSGYSSLHTGLGARDDPVTSSTMFEELTSIFPRASPPRRRRYSVRSFYWSLAIFTVLATLSWGLGRWSSPLVAHGFANPSLMKRENELEVPPLCPRDRPQYEY